MRSNGTIDATYRYTTFGGKAEITITPGTYAERNRYRFSTKYLGIARMP
jgi:opacity protein-like surface antigen